jgi:SAM-dependent methyltransferase
MNTARAEAMRETWERSFAAQVADQAYNTAPVEALVRTTAYYLRSRYTPDRMRDLRFLEMGSGAGPNLVWLAQKGIRVSGIDISETALKLCEKNLRSSGCADRIDRLVYGSVTDVPFPDASFDGILESCVFQHLNREDRRQAFAEVRRLLKPGGVFVGYMLNQGHTTFENVRAIGRRSGDAHPRRQPLRLLSYQHRPGAFFRPGGILRSARRFFRGRSVPGGVLPAEGRRGAARLCGISPEHVDRICGQMKEATDNRQQAVGRKKIKM